MEKRSECFQRLEGVHIYLKVSQRVSAVLRLARVPLVAKSCVAAGCCAGGIAWLVSYFMLVANSTLGTYSALVTYFM